jgi:hypothetical protein
MKVKNLVRKAILFAILMLSITAQLKAQPDDNGGDPPPNDVPLDDHIWLMIAVAVAYGSYLIWKARKRHSLA